MNYNELLEYLLDKGLDEQTALRLAEAISDAGGVQSVKSLLEDIS